MVYVWRKARSNALSLLKVVRAPSRPKFHLAQHSKRARSILGHPRFNLGKLSYHCLETAPNQLPYEDRSLFAHGLRSDVSCINRLNDALAGQCAFTDMVAPPVLQPVVSSGPQFHRAWSRTTSPVSDSGEEKAKELVLTTISLGTTVANVAWRL